MPKLRIKLKYKNNKIERAILVFIILLFAALYFKANISGLATFAIMPEEPATYADALNLQINSSQDYVWTPEYQGLLESVKLSGAIYGDGFVKVYLGDILILDSSTLERPHELQITEETKVIPFSDVCAETCSLGDLNLANENYKLTFEIENASLQLDAINYKISPIEEKMPEIKPINEENQNFVTSGTYSINQITSGWAIQNGEKTMTGATTTVGISAVNTSRAFILISRRAASTYETPDKAGIYAEWVNSTAFNLKQYNTTVYGDIVVWQVIEGASIRVQNGTKAYTSAQTSFDISITAVNTSRTVVFMTFGSCNNTGAYLNQIFWIGNVTTSTNLHIERMGYGKCAGNVSYFVTEFNDGSTIQTGQIANVGSETAPSYATVSAINMSNTWLYFSQTHDNTSTGLAHMGVMGRQNSTTVFRFARNTATGTAKVQWWVISTPGANVQYNVQAISNPASVNVTIPTAITTSRSFSFQSFNNSGTGTSFSNWMATSRITNTTNIYLQRATTTNTENMAWWVVQLPNVGLSWNQSTLSLGSVSQGTSAASNATATATGSHTNIDVTGLLSGNGTTLISATPADIGSMAHGAIQQVIFNCSPPLAQAAGYYEAVYNVNSTEYPAGNNITVSCTVTNEAVNPIATMGANPVDNYNSSSATVVFDTKCSDNNAVSTLQIWANDTGIWHALTTQTSPTNDSYYNISIESLTEASFIWGVRCNDTAGNIDWSDTNRTITVDATAPTVTNTAVNTTSANTADEICVNATVTDNLLPLSAVWAKITYPNGTAANSTMADTGPDCSGSAGDDVYGVSINAGDTAGNLTVNTTYANDTVTNLGSQSPFPNLQVSISSQACAIAVGLSDSLSSGISWTVATLPGNNQSANDNNGAGATLYNITVSITGSCTADLYIKANDDLITGDSSRIGLGNETYCYNITDSTVPEVACYQISTTYTGKQIGANLNDQDTSHLKFYLNVPGAQAAGTYTNNVTVKGIKYGDTP